MEGFRGADGWCRVLVKTDGKMELKKGHRWPRAKKLSQGQLSINIAKIAKVLAITGLRRTLKQNKGARIGQNWLTLGYLRPSPFSGGDSRTKNEKNRRKIRTQQAISTHKLDEAVEQCILKKTLHCVCCIFYAHIIHFHKSQQRHLSRFMSLFSSDFFSNFILPLFSIQSRPYLYDFLS